MLKKLFIILLFLLPVFCHGQNFEWANSGSYTKGETGYSLTTDNEGNSYYIGTFQDSIYFGSSLLIGSHNSSYIVKYTSDGYFVWAKKILNASGWGISTDNHGNLYITGGSTNIGSLYFTLNDSLNPGHFIAKYDTSGNFKWGKNVGKHGANKYTALDRNRNIYLSSDDGSDSIFMYKYDSLGRLIWKQKGSAHGHINDFSIDSNLNVYVAGSYTESISIGKYTLKAFFGKNNDDIFLYKLDSSGNVQWLKRAGGRHDDYGNGIKCFPNGNFYLAGQFFDTANFDGKFIGKGKGGYAFVAFFTKDGILKWVKKGGADSGSALAFTIALHKEYAYLGGAYSNCSPTFGHTILENSSYSNYLLFSKIDSNGNFLWSFGNGKKGATSVCYYFTTDTMGNSFCTGLYSGNATFGSFTLKNKGAFDAFMVKISDISLWRDKIIKTQYCAGDSILVPYHVSGIIGPGNTFHAELSDSNGSFDSVYYTIGKITRQGNGIIHCKLPANLPYSSRYNIHVYSDTPNVTSYYNPQTIEIYPNPIVKIAYDSPVCKSSLDTLHASGATSYLWLPSTALSDNKSANPVFKADTTRTYSIIAKNPGGCMDTTKFSITVGPELKLSILSPTKDTIVCSGSAVKLRAEAKGGYGLPYFYTWNKGLGNGDTLTIHPTFNDVYRVSTTGGCKATASVQIKVYAPLKVSAGKDQGICPGHSNHLHASGNGGDSSMYTFNWDNGLGTGADKIISTTNTKTYKVVLSENLCNLKPDSALITVYRTNPMKLFLPADTNLCYGQSVFARANGGDSLRYIYSWDTGGVVIPNWATARVAPTKSETYRCILTDSCSLHSDTAFVKVKVSPPLKLVMPKDTTICQGTSVTLSAHIFGGNGDTASYKYTWDTSGSIIAKTKNIITYPPYTTRFRCIVNDGCSSPDTGFVNVFIHPLYLSLKDTSVCKGEKVTLKIVGHGGDSNYIYTWRPGNFHADSVTLIADSSIHFDILLDDKCSIVGHTIFGYEAYLNFTVLPTPESNMKISPTSIEIGTGDIQFNALNTDADSFLWLFGDGIDGKGIKQTHTYQTDGTFSPRLISTNKYGCKDTAQGEVIILPQLQVYFPNVFTPDGDSLNETWMPVGIGISRINITIYDRWGGHVFKSESLTKGWNGNILDSNDLALPGVYPYIVNFWDFNNKKFIKTGTIHLLNAARY